MSVVSVGEPCRVLGQLSRFVTVGVANTSVSLLIYGLLLALGIHYLVAGGVAFAAGAANGYALNRRWTFRAAGSPRARVAYVAVQAFGLGASATLLWLLVDVGAVDRVAAQAASIPPVTLAMFALNRRVTFGAPSEL